MKSASKSKSRIRGRLRGLFFLSREPHEHEHGPLTRPRIDRELLIRRTEQEQRSSSRRIERNTSNVDLLCSLVDARTTFVGAWSSCTEVGEERWREVRTSPRPPSSLSGVIEWYGGERCAPRATGVITGRKECFPSSVTNVPSVMSVLDGIRSTEISTFLNCLIAFPFVVEVRGRRGARSTTTAARSEYRLLTAGGS